MSSLPKDMREEIFTPVLGLVQAVIENMDISKLKRFGLKQLIL